MQKRVFLIHGWDGRPHNNWFPWLTEELEARGFSVQAIALPHPETPTIDDWVGALVTAIQNPDEQTYLVGHSMGCQTIARYAAALPSGVRLGGAVFVAGFFKRLTDIADDPAEKAVVKEWLETPLDLQQVKTHLQKSVAIFSDNDPYVPLDNQDAFKNVLGSKIIIEKNQGHFSDDNGITQLPVARDELLALSVK